MEGGRRQGGEGKKGGEERLEDMREGKREGSRKKGGGRNEMRHIKDAM